MQAVQQQQTKQGHIVFLGDGTLTEEAKQMCIFNNIDPDSLNVLPLEAFMEKNVSERIARTRHKHYDEKRKANIRTIEEAIKKGKLDIMKEEYPFLLHGRNSKSANPHSPINLRHFYQTYASPAAGQGRSPNVEPDIALRVQLDQNTTIKQKIVNKEFEKMCLQLLQQNKDLQHEAREKKITQQMKKEEKQDKYWIETQKQKKQEIKRQAEDLSNTLAAKQAYVRDERRRQEREAREEADRIEEQRKADEKRKEQNRRDRLEQSFQKDLIDMKLKADKKGAYQQQLMQEDQIIQQKIEEGDLNFNSALRKKKMEVEKKVETAKKHSEDVQMAYNELKERQQAEQEHKIAEIITAQIKREKKKSRAPMDAKQMREKNEERMRQAKERLQDLKREQRDQKERLLEQKKQRESVAVEIRKELNEAHRDYFEIMKLKKLDQTEAFNREKYQFMLEKQKNALRIQEKALRVDLIKQQQSRIAQMCSQQRNPLAFGGQGDFNGTS